MTNWDIRIWHTLAKVELFLFLFVIKLLLQYRLIFFNFLFYNLFFVYKNLYLLSCLPT